MSRRWAAVLWGAITLACIGFAMFLTSRIIVDTTTTTAAYLDGILVGIAFGIISGLIWAAMAWGTDHEEDDP